MYEPATTAARLNLLKNLRLADINERISVAAQAQADKLKKEAGKEGETSNGSEDDQDTQFMVIFGGKNAEQDVLFNDIYFLGMP